MARALLPQKDRAYPWELICPSDALEGMKCRTPGSQPNFIFWVRDGQLASTTMLQRDLSVAGLQISGNTEDEVQTGT